MVAPILFFFVLLVVTHALAAYVGASHAKRSYSGLFRNFEAELEDVAKNFKLESQRIIESATKEFDKDHLELALCLNCEGKGTDFGRSCNVCLGRTFVKHPKTTTEDCAPVICKSCKGTGTLGYSHLCRGCYGKKIVFIPKGIEAQWDPRIQQ